MALFEKVATHFIHIEVKEVFDLDVVTATLFFHGYYHNDLNFTMEVAKENKNFNTTHSSDLCISLTHFKYGFCLPLVLEEVDILVHYYIVSSSSSQTQL